ncbi:MAG TPA: substrate-binding domain-containing protein [Opitutales bacterium]|nr:substrate-binding domain-containing protein [Opitutales bacterium]
MLKLFSRSIILCAALLQFASAQNREILGEYKIGIIGRDREDTIYQAAHLGARDAARELSEKYSIDVELLIATPESSQGSSQPTSLAELFLEKADGFIISPMSNEVVASSINFAMEQGQEVILFESELEGVSAMAAITADEVEAGRLAAKAILKNLPTKARVAILTSSSPSPQLEQRLKGVRSVLGYRRIEKVIETEPDYRAAVKTIREAQEEDRNDQIKGWIFLEDWPLLGMPALPWEPGKMPVVAIQSSPSAFIYADQGYLDALVVHPYYEWGYRSVVAMVEKLHNGVAPESPSMLTQPKVVDWRNLKEYREDWKTWFK